MRTTCRFLPFKHSSHFISISYGTLSTVTLHYHLLCSYERSNSQISEILVDIAGFHSYRLVITAGFGRRIGARGANAKFYQGGVRSKDRVFSTRDRLSKTDSVAKTPSFNENTTKITGIIFFRTIETNQT